MKKVTDAEGSETDQHYLVKELYKQEDAEFRRDEFAEKIIQYGYLVVCKLHYQTFIIIIIILYIWRIYI